MIEGAFLKYFGIPVALTWFMSQKTFDGKKPYSFLKSQITYAIRPKITYAGKAVKLHKQTLNETITAAQMLSLIHIYVLFIEKTSACRSNRAGEPASIDIVSHCIL